MEALTGSARGLRLVADLARHGDRLALATGTSQLSYSELAERVERRAGELGPTRRLVLVSGRNDVETVVDLLAALYGRHVAWLAPIAGPSRQRELVAAYDPDVVAVDGRLEIRRDGSAHQLHDELALLLSTSGTTASPKLVRLSAENIESNAAAIAQYLEIQPDDRAITTLPLHYCYGLSVLTSHLVQGAGIVLTEASVVDPCFWDLAQSLGVTSLAGVPHTFELLDRIGFTGDEVPTLRTVTQAGGRLSPESVVRYARMGRSHGWRFFVMYGQTEATARMAYLPPELAVDHPETIGVPIPGGALELAPCDDDPGVGELVYRGPNVMLGYAEAPADLARGRDVDALHTGDLARVAESGLFEVVGRRARMIKPFGLRVDLDQVERRLRSVGVTSACTGDDSRLVIAVEEPADPDAVETLVSTDLAIPRGAIEVRAYAPLPRLENGKPDLLAIARSATGEDPRRRADRSPRDVFAAVFDLRSPEIGDHQSFVSLGGDSLSYVEASIRLERVLGTLPEDWHHMTVAELSRLPRHRRRVASLETNVVLRAAAIVLVVGTHMSQWFLRGGAHVLLAIAGFNFARFQLAAVDVPDRARRAIRSIARIAVPTSVWIGVQMAVAGGYSVGALLLVNNYVGDSHRREGRWQYWYLETLVQILVVLALVFASRRARDAERRHPFALPLALLAPALVLRFEWVQLGDPYNYLFRTHTIAWLFLLGWAIARASTTAQRVVVSGVAALAVPGFFDEPVREAIVLGGLLVLVWVPVLAVPRPLDRVIGALAAASMFIYLVHWQVWPVTLRIWKPPLAFAATLATGVAVWWLVERLMSRRFWAGSVPSRVLGGIRPRS